MRDSVLLGIVLIASISCNSSISGSSDQRQSDMRVYEASVDQRVSVNDTEADAASDDITPQEITAFADLPLALREKLGTLSPLTPPPVDISNEYSDDVQAAKLGQKFFFDPGFYGKLLDADNDGSSFSLGKIGETGKVACSGCHLPHAGFQDNRSPSNQVSLAAGWGLRKTPSLLDVGQARLLMWDGRRDTLYNQVFGALESPVEMNTSRLFVAQEIYRRYRAEYESIFGEMPPLDDPQRFPKLSANASGCQTSNYNPSAVCDGSLHGMPGDGAEFDSLSVADQKAVTGVVVNFGKAVAAYQRLLTCGPSRFDAWVAGDTHALTVTEKKGALLFVDKARCIQCHVGPYMSDQSFHNVGLKPSPVAFGILDENDMGAIAGLQAALSDPLNVKSSWSDGDDGRLPVTVGPAYQGAFRTPMLRCVSRRASMMHTGQLRTLHDVVKFFNRGGDASGYPGVSEITPLGLTHDEELDLVAFLKALDGPGPAKELLTYPTSP